MGNKKEIEIKEDETGEDKLINYKRIMPFKIKELCNQLAPFFAGRLR